jgi:hypothetical protein
MSNIFNDVYKAGHLPINKSFVHVNNFPINSFGNLKSDPTVYHHPFKWSNSQFNVSAETFSSGNIKTGYSELLLQSDVPAEAYGMVCSRDLLEIRIPDRTGALTFARFLGSGTLYQSGTAMECRFTAIFEAGSYIQPVTGRDEQYVGFGNVVNATTATPDNFLGVGYSGSTDGVTGSEFGIFYIRGGVKTFIPQSQFNNDTLDGDNGATFVIDPTKINVFSVEVGYLGAANIDFKVLYENNWILFHRFHFPNNINQTNLSDPSLAFLMQITPTIPSGSSPAIGTSCCGNGSNVVIKYGYYTFTDSHSYENEVSISAATETPVAILRNAPTWFGKRNSALIKPLLVNLAADGAKNVIYRIYLTTTANISGASWVAIDADYSPAEYSTAGTLLSGTKIFSIAGGKAESVLINMEQFEILKNGDNAWFVTAESANTSDIIATISWTEFH